MGSARNGPPAPSRSRREASGIVRSWRDDQEAPRDRPLPHRLTIQHVKLRARMRERQGELKSLAQQHAEGNRPGVPDGWAGTHRLRKTDPDVRRILPKTTTEIPIHFPVCMDNGNARCPQTPGCSTTPLPGPIRGIPPPFGAGPGQGAASAAWQEDHRRFMASHSTKRGVHKR